MSDPRDDGFFMPPEWATHTRCWMAWPCHPDAFPRMGPARDAFANVARTIARFEPVCMIANPEHTDDARHRCGDGIEVVSLEIGDSWTRDTGPTWLIDGRGNLAGVDWRFNAYGEIYSSYRVDDDLARRLLERTGARRYRAPIVLEGGAIHTDGRGTLLTTESVVLHPNRNPGLGREEAEKVFRAFLGVEKVIWLENALEVDATDGHVDNLACFVRPGVVVVLGEEDPGDPHYRPLRENRRRLERAEDASGRRLEILEIQQPARREQAGDRLGLSYVNFYIANDAAVVPVFDDPADGPALEILGRALPGYEIAPVPGLEIVTGEGCVHCITQQEPAP